MAYQVKNKSGLVVAMFRFEQDAELYVTAEFDATMQVLTISPAGT